uniref:Uncharacterized protein n=1 Tax=Anopheles darlingi TaxID=43151 RepID=A0A2M4DQ07_ANODA
MVVNEFWSLLSLSLLLFSSLQLYTNFGCLLLVNQTNSILPDPKAPIVGTIILSSFALSVPLTTALSST